MPSTLGPGGHPIAVQHDARHGSGDHHEGPPRPTCGYDPEMVKPAMPITEALSATLQHAVDIYGLDGACERIPGLYKWSRVCKPCFTRSGPCLGCFYGKDRQP